MDNGNDPNFAGSIEALELPLKSYFHMSDTTLGAWRKKLSLILLRKLQELF